MIAAELAPEVQLPRQTMLKVAALALAVGSVSLVWSLCADVILAYSDTLSHLNIARRLLDSRTPGVAQLGTVWLPVPHILMLPLVWLDPLWQTGLAGSVVGLLCLTATSLSLFASIRLITHQPAAAWVGLAVLLTNPNLLYLHTTALTEPVLLMTMTSSAYFLLRWTRAGKAPSLMAAGILCMLAIGSRYDGWFFAAVCTGIVLIVTLTRSRSRDVAEGLTLAYCVLPVFGMFLWLYYNWLIWSDPLEFLHGPFSAEVMQNQIAEAGVLKTNGDLLLSTLTYSLTVVHNTGVLVLILGVAGLIVYTLRLRRLGGSLASYAFLAAYPFNILALYVGQTTISLPESSPPGYFNVRYGAMMVPGVALFTAYAFDQLSRVLPPRLWGSTAGAILALQATIYVPRWPLSIITVADGLIGTSARPPRSDAARYLAAHYRGGGILIDDDKNPQAVFEAGVPMREYIGTFSGNLWQQALTDPGSQVEWVFVGTRTREDRVAAALLRSNVLQREFALEFEDPARGQAVYHRAGAHAG